MNNTALRRIVTLGAITGMRSMSGPAALALERSSPFRSFVPLLAAAEMVVDKTSMVGDRTDPLPLAGRAVMGAVAGGLVAREYRQNIAAGSLIGAGTAVIAAYLAFHLRRRLPLSGVLAGVAEDALVVGLGAAQASR
jgi:uncharacterized membrane protein